MLSSDININQFFLISDELMAITSREGLFQKINPAFEKILGYNNEQLFHKNFQDIVHPEDLSITMERFRNSLVTGKSIPMENKLLCSNQEYKWFQWHKIILSGDLVYVIGKDITLQKEQYQFLKILDDHWKSKSDLLDLVLNSIPEYICLLNEKLEFVYVNKTAAARMGGTQQYFIGRTAEQANYNFNGIEKYKEEVKEVMATGTEVHRTLSILIESTWKEIEYSILPIKNEDASVGVIYIARDVTNFYKANKSFESSERKLKNIIELVPYPIFLKDHQYRYTLCNQAQAKLFNSTIENVLGKTDADFVKDPAELEFIQNSDKNILEENTSIVLPEQVLSDNKGEKRILHTTKIPFLNEMEQTINILGISIDLTDIRKAEEELIRTNFELDSFVYKSSHDLRAPLRSLIGLLNLARKEKDPNMLNEILDRSNKSITKLDTFISDLTNFSRNSRLDFVHSKIDFEQIIHDCIENLKFMDNAQQVKLLVDITMKKEFYSDQNRMSILLMNLISNALKYYDPEKKSPYLKIEVKDEDKGVELTIEDNGIGIEKEFHTKIFDMFFRASEKAFGSGLGLYIVKQVTEKLGGSITIQSEVGVGSTFIIKLPSGRNYNSLTLK